MMHYKHIIVQILDKPFYGVRLMQPVLATIPINNTSKFMDILAVTDDHITIRLQLPDCRVETYPLYAAGHFYMYNQRVHVPLNILPLLKQRTQALQGEPHV